MITQISSCHVTSTDLPRTEFIKSASILHFSPISHWGYHDDIADRHSVFISLGLTLFENDIFAEYPSLSACLSRSITPYRPYDSRFHWKKTRASHIIITGVPSFSTPRLLLDQSPIAYHIGDCTKSNISWSFSESRE